jgi:hypothetical protein
VITDARIWDRIGSAGLEPQRLHQRVFVREIVDMLGPRSAEEIYPFWCALLRTLSSHPRAELLACLELLRPLIVRLGGERALLELADSVHDVGCWFP